jgi:hypothetical protein
MSIILGFTVYSLCNVRPTRKQCGLQEPIRYGKNKETFLRKYENILILENLGKVKKLHGNLL